MMDSRNGDTPLRVGISGSYGGFNLGNEAILQVILDERPRFAPLEITVFSRDAKARAAAIVSSTSPNCVGHLGVRRRRPLHLDLFILGGGDLLYDADADMYLREVGLADDVGNPAMTYAISAGPLVDPAYARGCAPHSIMPPLSPSATVTRDNCWRNWVSRRKSSWRLSLPCPLQPEPPTLEEVLRAEAIDGG